MVLDQGEIEVRNSEAVEEDHQQIQVEPHQPQDSRDHCLHHQMETSSRIKHPHEAEVVVVPTTEVEEEITEVGEGKAGEMLANNPPM